MTKINPRYSLVITTPDKVITIEYPLTCQYSITRNTFASSNTAIFKIYNLAPETRNRIFHDRFNLKVFKFVDFYAGYDGNLTRIFSGKINQAYSYKASGSVDVITEIQCFDSDTFSYSSHTFEAGTSYKDALLTMASDMKNTQVGAIGTLEGNFKIPTIFDETSFYAINKLTGGHTFIDNGILNTLQNNEALGNYGVYKIDSNSGLLGTPMRRDAELEMEMIFEPDIVVGQLVEIDSSIQKDFNGQFKVIGIQHDGVISGAEAGTRTTKLNLYIGSLIPSSTINSQGFKTVKDQKVEPVDEKLAAGAIETYRYLQENNGKLPNTKITKNISWAEMIGNNNTDTERKQECSIGILSNVALTAQKMQIILNKYFRGRTITINSGWRSTRNNRSCNGNPKSKHLYGLAMDFTISGTTPQEVQNIMSKAWQGWVGNYPGFTHVQTEFTQGKANDR